MPKILLIEDNPGDARLIYELLKQSQDLGDKFEILHTERLAEAILTLESDSVVDIILSDITLPDSSGIDTLHALIRSSSTLPVIFMTGTNDMELAKHALKQGAQDYLVKGRFNGDTLARALEYAITRKKSQNEMELIRKREHENLQHIATLATEKKQLIELGRSKDEFIALASHQLRTPATAVKQYVGLLLEGYDGTLTATQTKHLQAAFDSNERQLSIINQLLKTAQLDEHKKTLDISSCNITGLIREIVASYEPVVRLKRQHVIFDDTKDVIIEIDVSEIKLVLDNLVENASKYTPEQKNIYISVHRLDDGTGIDIRDEGVGIEEKDQIRIFDKFTRVDNELSDTVTGSGLGLYWVKRIMELHHGSIDVVSHPGQGSTFSLRFPL